MDNFLVARRGVVIRKLSKDNNEISTEESENNNEQRNAERI
ncbi:hypothetical protein [Lactococcus nasutitermitis]